MAFFECVTNNRTKSKPQFIENTSVITISSGDTISFNADVRYNERIVFNGYQGRFTVKFVNASLNPSVQGLKTDNTIIQLTNNTTYDASEFTELFKIAFASGYYANIVFL